MTVVLGLDLSLKAAAAVAVPTWWDGEWDKVRSMVVGETLRRDASPAERARRTETIAARIAAFAECEGCSVAYVEQYAFGNSQQAHSLGELGGVVKLELVRRGIQLHTVPIPTIRKVLLGKVPRTGAKVAVMQALRAAGCPIGWSLDEADAFAVANWGLSELGGYCFAQGG